MITYGQFKAAFPKARESDLHKFYPYLNAAMQEFEIDNPNRISFFLAQVAHESGNFRHVEEIASGRAYERREDLGNLKKEALAAAHAKGTTTGKFFRGHGLIQITGFNNHKQCGIGLGLDLVNYPGLLTEAQHAVRSAAWFFKWAGCNEIADSGDFKACTRRINGGFNGLVDRETKLASVSGALGYV